MGDHSIILFVNQPSCQSIRYSKGHFRKSVSYYVLLQLYTYAGTIGVSDHESTFVIIRDTIKNEEDK